MFHCLPTLPLAPDCAAGFGLCQRRRSPPAGGGKFRHVFISATGVAQAEHFHFFSAWGCAGMSPGPRGFFFPPLVAGSTSRVLGWCYWPSLCLSASSLPAKNEGRLPNQRCAVAAQSSRRYPHGFRLRPTHCFCVENMQILQMLAARMPGEQVQLPANICHCVGVARERLNTRDVRLSPCHCVKVQNVDIAEAPRSIVAPKHDKFAIQKR